MKKLKYLADMHTSPVMLPTSRFSNMPEPDKW
ncbi:hypothetical protein Adeg_0263 [Ammonifex degensii KC4]|uniref:Uncharacterized protein n=1 Tax=Ammonifex degensii (strain DSM 10501 / KC4) TaxID=429009 RepID=C9RB05_AMMDK|nr:hypothetical protein Adeg_0263 [Ammonifex degensii KC4]